MCVFTRLPNIDINRSNRAFLGSAVTFAWDNTFQYSTQGLALWGDSKQLFSPQPANNAISRMVTFPRMMVISVLSFFTEDGELCSGKA